MEIIRDNWVQMAVFLLILLLTFIGYRRGMVKTLFSLVSVPLSAVITNLIEPTVQGYVLENKAFRAFVSSKVREILEDSASQYLSSLSDGTVRSALSGNGSSTIQLGNGLFPSGDLAIAGEGGLSSLSGLLQSLGASDGIVAASNAANASIAKEANKLIETLTEQISEVLIKALLFLVLMALVSLALKICFGMLNQVAELPGLNFANRFFGAFFGLVQAVCYVWIFLLIVSLLPDNALISDISRQCNRSGTWLWYLKEYNILSHLFLTLAGTGT